MADVAAAADRGAPAAREPLVPAMRRATRRHHNIANALILAKLAFALTDKRLYAKALGQFLPVYSELERQLEKHRASEALKGVAEVALGMPSRAAAMRRDLEDLLGPGWAALVPPSASAEAYAARLRELGGEDPSLLLPYAWSLHVPILLGFFGRRVAGGLGVAEGGKGLAFFEVPEKADRLSQLRAAVNAAGEGLPQATYDRCVAGAAEQFTRNNAVVREFRLPLSSAAAAARRAAAAALRGPGLALLLVLVAVLVALRAGEHAGGAAVGGGGAAAPAP